MNYYQFHIADWALHTSHLSLEEEGIYRRLLDYYYDTEQPIPEKTDSVIRRLRLGAHSETVALILEEFFILKPDGWHNLRADREIDVYNEKANRARENGKKGGRPKKRKVENQSVIENGNREKTQSVNHGMQEETESKANQEPRTTNQEPLTNTKKTNVGFDADAAFAEFWERYPRGEGKKTAMAKFKTKCTSDVMFAEIMQGLANQIPLCRDLKFFPHATTWLNGERWLDEIKTGGGKESVVQQFVAMGGSR